MMKYVIIAASIFLLYLIFQKESFVTNIFANSKLMRDINNYSKSYFENEKTDLSKFCKTSFLKNVANFKQPNIQMNTGNIPFFDKVYASTESDKLDSSKYE